MKNANAGTLETDRGDKVSAKFCIMAVGCLSAPNRPSFEGLEDFRGPDLSHRRMAASGCRLHRPACRRHRYRLLGDPVDSDHRAAGRSAHRVPAHGDLVGAGLERKADAGISAGGQSRLSGAPRQGARTPDRLLFSFQHQAGAGGEPGRPRQEYEEAWARGGLPFLGAYGDLLFEKAANDTIADFARGKIRSIVKDPATADLLCPDNVFGCKRLCVDTGYFETYNLPHVKLVDVSKTPIERFTAEGIEVNGVEYPLDAVVCATGFAAMTGSFDKIRITGRNGLTLAEKWRAGPRAYLGIASAGFPNLFLITGPGSPSVLASMIQAIEQHVDWLADCIGHMRDVGATCIEPILEDEDAWVEHVTDVSTVSLRSTCSSWYVGSNTPGRPRVFMPYIGGFPVYVQKCNEVMSGGFEGFVLEGAAGPQRGAPGALYGTLAGTDRYRRHFTGGRRREARPDGVKRDLMPAAMEPAFGGIADMTGLAAGSTRSRLTQNGSRS